MARVRVVFLLLFFIVAVAALASCSHSSYTESTSTTFVFYYGDQVVTSPGCSSGKSFINKCNRLGTVVSYSEAKNRCYPQPEYVVKTFNQDKYVTFNYCADELELDTNIQY